MVTSNSVVVKLTKSVAEKLKKEAQKLDMSLDEYLLELVLRDLDPHERAEEYIKASKGLLGQAKDELREGNTRQAAEKLWGTTALAVKAYAEWRDAKRLTIHKELWEYSRKLIDELGGWTQDSWMNATGMHVCFYEGWCTKRHVEEAIKRIEKLVSEIEEKIEQEKIQE